MINFLKKIYQLSNVYRWSRCDLIKQQNVAEHSYYVAMITMCICEEVFKYSHDKSFNSLSLIKYALMHDVPEAETGDIIAPVKDLIGDDFEDSFTGFIPNELKECNATFSIETVKAIIKIADLLERILYLSSEIRKGNKSVLYLINYTVNRLEKIEISGLSESQNKTLNNFKKAFLGKVWLNG